MDILIYDSLRRELIADMNVIPCIYLFKAGTKVLLPITSSDFNKDEEAKTLDSLLVSFITLQKYVPEIYKNRVKWMTKTVLKMQLEVAKIKVM